MYCSHFSLIPCLKCSLSLLFVFQFPTTNTLLFPFFVFVFSCFLLLSFSLLSMMTNDDQLWDRGQTWAMKNKEKD